MCSLCHTNHELISNVRYILFLSCACTSPGLYGTGWGQLPALGQLLRALTAQPGAAQAVCSQPCSVQRSVLVEQLCTSVSSPNQGLAAGTAAGVPGGGGEGQAGTGTELPRGSGAPA